MSRLRTILQSKASKWIHVAIVPALIILGTQYRLSYLALAIELWVLFKKDKTLLIYACILALIAYWRFNQSMNDVRISFPMTAKVVWVQDDYFIVENNTRYRCYGPDLSTLKPGMTVMIEGEVMRFESYDIMKTFDYELYLRSQNIQASIAIDHIEIKQQSFHLSMIRYLMFEKIDERYSEEIAFYIKLLLFGQKDDYYNGLKNDANALGITHLFAISGMHLGLLVAMLNQILKRFYLSKEKHRLIIILFLIIYQLLTGFLVSIMRASLLIIGIYAKDFFRLVLSTADLLSFSFIGFLLWRPALIFGLGFQLSYLIAFSIILSQNLLHANSRVKKTLVTSLLATAFSLPLILQASGELSLFFLVFNLFFIYYVSFLLLPSTLLVLIFSQFVSLYRRILIIFEQAIDIGVHINRSLSFNFTQSMYVILYWLFLVLLMMNYRSVKKRLILMCALVLLFVSNALFPHKSLLFVRFLDVGQGDAIHLYDHGAHALIDTGDKDRFHRLADYFAKHQVKKIDTLIITHFHEDHYGELTYLLATFEVQHLYLNQDIGEQDFIYHVLKESDVVEINTIRLFVLSANHQDDNENNNAIVLYGRIGLDRYMFTSDIEIEIESKLLQSYRLDVDVLKVAHHGSNTSSSIAFLKETSPKYAVITVGEYNHFNHPHPEVTDTLASANTLTMRTDQDGTITFHYYPLFQLRLIEMYHFRSHPRYLL